MTTPWRFEFGVLWVRTECMEHELTMRYANTAAMAALTTQVSAHLQQQMGFQMTMEATGWAGVPAGYDPREACTRLDAALAAVLTAKGRDDKGPVRPAQPDGAFPALSQSILSMPHPSDIGDGGPTASRAGVSG